jgi:glycosyltransferase involved in cell wall biosynthesis
VLWNGSLGGAETFTVDLCRTMRNLGAEVGVVFVAGSEPLGDRLDTAGIPQMSLELGSGREITYHPRKLAKFVREFGRDGALLPRGGYLAAALRAGGYRGTIVAVAHDALLGLGPVGSRERLVQRVDRATGFWASNVEVAVSNFVASHMQRQMRIGRLVRIYNGVDLDTYAGTAASRDREAVTIACAGRLIVGKGIDVLLRAFSAGAAREGARLRIAGDGPTRPELQSLARDLRLDEAVEFTGSIVDMPSFWRACDIATQPSATFVESFGMAAVEAMACARPVVATANGALPELVEDGVTGSVVPRGDVGALAEALLTLTRDAKGRRAAGAAARVRCEQLFDLRDCAASYLELFRDN